METLSYAIDKALNYPENNIIAILVVVVLIAIGLMTNIIQKIFGFLFSLIFKHRKDKSDISTDFIGRDLVNGDNNYIDNSSKINNNFNSAPSLTIKDIEIRMKAHYRRSNISRSPYFQLKTTEDSTITEFHFLDLNKKKIGRSIPFYKILNSDVEKVSDYYFESDNEVEIFIQSLYKQQGIIRAHVETADSLAFTFTYKAVQGNWKQTYEENHPNLEDQFLLIKKDKFVPEINITWI